MSTLKLTNFINGEFVPPISGSYIKNINPSTNELNNLVPDSDSRDVSKALISAEKALPNWSSLSFESRSVFLDKIANLMESNEYKSKLILSDVKDMGKPITFMSTIDFNVAVDAFRSYSSLVKSMHSPMYQNKEYNIYERFEEIGIVGLISPWNFPLMLFCMKIAPAIICGNTCLAKPTELAPTSAMIMCEIFKKSGIPNGVINVINGYGPKAAEPFVSDERVGAISFTGGTVTGKRVSMVAAPKLKKLQLELGGKNPAIVFNDCYFEETINGVLMSSFLNTGQVCCSGSRIFVERGIADKFINALVETCKKTYSKNIGDPLNTSTLLGPLVSEQHFKKVTSYLTLAKKEGGKIILGGKYGSKMLGINNNNLKNGFFVEPTIVVNLKENCRCLKEEIFGPISTIQIFDNETELIKMANNTEYGLAASVWTSDFRKSQRISKKIKAGTLWINNYFGGDSRLAFGGYKKSGVNREGGMHSIRFFTEVKAMVSKL